MAIWASIKISEERSVTSLPPSIGTQPDGFCHDSNFNILCTIIPCLELSHEFQNVRTELVGTALKHTFMLKQTSQN